MFPPCTTLVIPDRLLTLSLTYSSPTYSHPILQLHHRTVILHTLSSRPITIIVKPNHTPPPTITLMFPHFSSPSRLASPRNFYPLPRRDANLISDLELQPYNSLLLAAVVYLTKVISLIHNDSKTVISNFREEFSLGPLHPFIICERIV